MVDATLAARCTHGRRKRMECLECGGQRDWRHILPHVGAREHLAETVTGEHADPIGTALGRAWAAALTQE